MTVEAAPPAVYGVTVPTFSPGETASYPVDMPPPYPNTVTVAQKAVIDECQACVTRIHAGGDLPILHTARGDVYGQPWVWFRFAGGCPFQIINGMCMSFDFRKYPMPDDTMVHELLWLDYPHEPRWNQQLEIQKLLGNQETSVQTPTRVD